jgi:hypothetical protein
MEPPVIIKLLAHDLVKKAHSAQLFMHNISKLGEDIFRRLALDNKQEKCR